MELLRVGPGGAGKYQDGLEGGGGPEGVLQDGDGGDGELLHDGVLLLGVGDLLEVGNVWCGELHHQVRVLALAQQGGEPLLQAGLRVLGSSGAGEGGVGPGIRYIWVFIGI